MLLYAFFSLETRVEKRNIFVVHFFQIRHAEKIYIDLFENLYYYDNVQFFLWWFSMTETGNGVGGKRHDYDTEEERKAGDSHRM